MIGGYLPLRPRNSVSKVASVVTRDASVMPSYIFVRMHMSASLHFLISDFQYVISFVGADRGGRSMSGQVRADAEGRRRPHRRRLAVHAVLLTVTHLLALRVPPASALRWWATAASCARCR